MWPCMALVALPERNRCLMITRSSFQFSISVAKWAAIRAYTPPEAPARKTFGSRVEVPRDPKKDIIITEFLYNFLDCSFSTRALYLLSHRRNRRGQPSTIHDSFPTGDRQTAAWSCWTLCAEFPREPGNRWRNARLHTADCKRARKCSFCSSNRWSKRSVDFRRSCINNT